MWNEVLEDRALFYFIVSEIFKLLMKIYLSNFKKAHKKNIDLFSNSINQSFNSELLNH